MGGHAPTETEDARIMQGEKNCADEEWLLCSECKGQGCFNCSGCGEVPNAEKPWPDEVNNDG